MLTHLDEIEAPLNKLQLGFAKMEPRPTWNVYLDTWRKIDAGGHRINHLPLYDLMVNHYCGKTKPRLQYERQLLELKTGDCKRIAKAWVKRHIKLYQDIKRDGFKPSLRNKPLEIWIRKNGELAVKDGTHTISILKHLETHKTIKMKVVNRGAKWVELKQRLYKIYGKKLLYQPIDHPDFDDWIVDRPSPHRWNIIEETLGDVKGISIVDVGCCTGFFSHRLAKKGAQVTGLEPHEPRHQVCKTLSEYHELSKDNPLFLTDTFEKHLRHNKYDVALVLSVLHHYLRKDPKLFYDAVKRISKSCDRMILEVGTNRQPIRWKPELVTEHSKYDSYTQLYFEERPIYLFA